MTAQTTAPATSRRRRTQRTPKTVRTPRTPRALAWLVRPAAGAGVALVANVIAAPVRWGLGAAAGGVVATGSAEAGLAGLLPLGARFALWILTRSDQRSSIVITLSSRVKSARLKRRVRRRWTRAMSRAELVKPSLAPATPGAKDVPKRGRVRVTPYGVRVDVRLDRVGKNATDVAGKMDTLLATFGAKQGSAAAPAPGRAVLSLRHTDPLRRVVRVADLEPARRPFGAVVGIDEDGAPVEKDLTRPNLLVGAQGAGKSSEAWTTLRALHTQGIPVRLRVFDPKGGAEFGSLHNAAYQYERNPFRWPDTLGRVVSAMMARLDDMRERGLRELDRFTVEDPLDLLVVDELVSVLTMRGAKCKVGRAEMSVDDAFLLYLSQARAAGFSCIALTQLAEKQVIGPVRSLFSYATCLRVGALEKDIVDVVLGRGAAAAYPAHRIPVRGSEGVGYTLIDGEIRRYRAAHLYERERRSVIDQVRRDTARFRAVRRGGAAGGLEVAA